MARLRGGVIVVIGVLFLRRFSELEYKRSKRFSRAQRLGRELGEQLALQD
jgi:hypothetical protein